MFFFLFFFKMTKEFDYKYSTIAWFNTNFLNNKKKKTRLKKGSDFNTITYYKI